MKDFNAKWSTATCIVCTFLGFSMGFLACHKIYTISEEKIEDLFSEYR